MRQWAGEKPTKLLGGECATNGTPPACKPGVPHFPLRMQSPGHKSIFLDRNSAPPCCVPHIVPCYFMS